MGAAVGAKVPWLGRPAGRCWKKGTCAHVPGQAMTKRTKRRKKQRGHWPWIAGAGGGVLALLVAVFALQLNGSGDSPPVESPLAALASEREALEAEMLRGPT